MSSRISTLEDELALLIDRRDKQFKLSPRRAPF
jgi:hypothetical protein